MRSRIAPRAPLVHRAPALVVALLVIAGARADAQDGARPAPKPASRPAAGAPAAPPPAVPAAPAPPATTTASPGTPDAQRAARALTLHEGPEGRALGTLAPGTVATPVARDGGWVRVRLEAWVREVDLEPVDSTISTQLAAADLRADPEGTKGRTVRWEVELLAFQVADPLRRELAAEEPYLLVRGPGSENALIYLALPPSLVPVGRSLAPLSRLVVTARVRSGRSAPTGLPVLDVLSITPRRRG